MKRVQLGTSSSSHAALPPQLFGNCHILKVTIKNQKDVS